MMDIRIRSITCSPYQIVSLCCIILENREEENHKPFLSYAFVNSSKKLFRNKLTSACKGVENDRGNKK